MYKHILGVAVGVALSGATASWAASCDDAADQAAFHVRSLQTELMVAALTCGAREDYNEFAVKFKKPLTDQGKGLKRHFKATYGAAADPQLNAYVTALANRLSERSIAARDSYCDRAARTFAALSVMKPADLAGFSMNRATGDVDVPSSCRPTVAMVEKNR